MTFPVWDTSCRDWEERIAEGRSLIPFAPLFPTEAEAALAIFRSLRIVDAANRPTFGEAALPWILDFVAAIFGSYDHSVGRRLIQHYMLLISKKNGKSTLAAGIMVTALVRNWRESGEFYILAPTKEIADNSYIPAVDMVRADPDLRSILKPSAGRVIEHRNTGAFLKVVAADSETVGGKKTIGLLVDELWLFGKKAGSENMLVEAEGGLASRPEGFVIYATTQSDAPPAGVFDRKLKDFRDIRDGRVDDRTKLPVLYEFPRAMIEDERYLERRYWRITNPNLGVSVDENYIVGKLEEAQRSGKALVNAIVAKHLNVEISQNMRADGWAGADVWERGIEVGLTLDTLLARCEVVTMGVDGGGLDDLLGVAVIGREKGTKRWLAWGHALISDIGLERRKKNAEDYAKFESEGTLTKFEYRKPVTLDLVKQPDGSWADKAGTPVDVTGEQRDAGRQFIIDIAKRLLDSGLLAQVGVDAAGIGAIVDDLAEIGITQDADKLDPVRQGIALMGAIKTVEIKLADYSFRHGGSAMMSWCVGNLRVVPTPTAMRVARDEAGFGKVDPVMAMFNAAHLMSLNPAAAQGFITEKALVW